MKLRILILLAATFSLSAYNPNKIKVMGTVAGRAVTDRQVALDVMIESPSKMKNAGANLKPQMSDQEMDQGFQRVLTQMMIIEEGRIVGLEKISPETLSSEVQKVKKEMGSQGFQSFLKLFEIKESDVKDIIQDKLHVKDALTLKLRSAKDLAANSKNEKIEPARVLEDWLKQLRSRYRVQIFRYDNDR